MNSITSVQITFDDLQENLNEDTISVNRDEVLALIQAALNLGLPVIVNDENTSDHFRLVESENNSFQLIALES